MGSGLARIAFLLALPLAAGNGIVAASAADCPGNPNAIGTSRTIVVDPRDHIRIGTMDYAETLPLADREVVLTFDDGPIPPYTTRVLDILAANCVKANYFIVGEMAKEYPALVRRAYDEGHTIGTHSMNHPLRFRALSVDRGNAQIADGIAATAAALGDPAKVAPFFRFPGFGHTAAAHEYAAEQGLMVWGADVPADDWHKLGPNEVARRAVQRLEYKGKGILLLHDIHQRTVEALPLILQELKERGFRIVHVVPSSPERPATVTAAADWQPGQRRIQVASALPTILLADVLEPNGDRLMKKSDTELCALYEPARETSTRMARRNHARIARAEAKAHEGKSHKTRHAEAKEHKTRHASADHDKPKHGKKKADKSPDKVATAPAPDVHAIQ
jgi:peptidoglycan/xylan/chitin deacetylase (PgdA/CDA1 family)